jgi:hypothetical protein
MIMFYIDWVVLAYLVYASGFVNYLMVADEYVRTSVENGMHDLS